MNVRKSSYSGLPCSRRKRKKRKRKKKKRKKINFERNKQEVERKKENTIPKHFLFLLLPSFAIEDSKLELFDDRMLVEFQKFVLDFWVFDFL
jgi:hypothetical protein